jgi:hypothetical protein
MKPAIADEVALRSSDTRWQWFGAYYEQNRCHRDGGGLSGSAR